MLFSAKEMAIDGVEGLDETEKDHLHFPLMVD